MQLTISRMALLLQGALQSKQLADEEIESLRIELNSLQSESNVLRREWLAERARSLAVSRQEREHSEHLEAELGSAKLERIQALELLDNVGRTARTWEERYQLVDAERRVYEDEIARRVQCDAVMNSPATFDEADVQVVNDVQLCPNCNESNLDLYRDSEYQCRFCGAMFRLQLTVD